MKRNKNSFTFSITSLSKAEEDDCGTLNFEEGFSTVLNPKYNVNTQKGESWGVETVEKRQAVLLQ